MSQGPTFSTTGAESMGHTPWWYAWVKSWRWRMWFETGIWER
jgi:hypothetical protein